MGKLFETIIISREIGVHNERVQMERSEVVPSKSDRRVLKLNLKILCNYAVP